MSVDDFALALLDDVGVGLENGKDLFAGGHVFAQQAGGVTPPGAQVISRKSPA